MKRFKVFYTDCSYMEGFGISQAPTHQILELSAADAREAWHHIYAEKGFYEKKTRFVPHTAILAVEVSNEPEHAEIVWPR